MQLNVHVHCVIISYSTPFVTNDWLFLNLQSSQEPNKTIMAEDVVVFHKDDLPKTAFPVFESIRRLGKLCDVTLKVILDYVPPNACTYINIDLNVNLS